MKKTLIALGDSITVGTYTAPSDRSSDSISSPNYAELVAASLGYTELINYAQNGTCISPLKGPFPSDALLFKFDKALVGDAIIVSGGTNDYAAEIPIGTPGDSCEDTFLGAARLLFEKIKNKYIPEHVYVITPIKREEDGKNGVGYTHREYGEALSLLAREFGFFLIDGYGVPINPKNPEEKKKYMLDGLHPGPEGHRLYAEYIISKITIFSKINLSLFFYKKRLDFTLVLNYTYTSYFFKIITHNYIFINF